MDEVGMPPLILGNTPPVESRPGCRRCHIASHRIPLSGGCCCSRDGCGDHCAAVAPPWHPLCSVWWLQSRAGTRVRWCCGHLRHRGGGAVGAIVPMVVVDVPPPNAFSSVGGRGPGVMLVLVVNARV